VYSPQTSTDTVEETIEPDEPETPSGIHGFPYTSIILGLWLAIIINKKRNLDPF
jgi:hypothetical protein